MMREQWQILVLTPCKDWNSLMSQDQSLNKDKSWRLVIGFIAGIAKAFEALDSRLLVGKGEININHRNSYFMSYGFPCYRAVLKCTVLPSQDIQPISSPKSHSIRRHKLSVPRSHRDHCLPDAQRDPVERDGGSCRR
jgi:hypothetical protein